jgi:hypothetical protein
MPAALANSITAKDHAKYFCTLDAEDMWTADGWLVTSCYGPDELTSQIRKGYMVSVRVFAPTDLLYFNVTKAKTRRMLAQLKLIPAKG